jgi:pimeloyl-ACP methyl ester carboxylesterase
VAKYFKKAPVELVNQFQQFQVSHRIQSVKLQETLWQYVIAGHSRYPLILLPGEERFAEYWFRLVLALQNKQQVLAITLPALDTIAAYTQGLAELLDYLKMPEIDLLGTSLGGCIAQEFVRRYPHRVRRLVLANSFLPDCRLPHLSRFFARISPHISTSYLHMLKKLHLLRLVSIAGRERGFWKELNLMIFDQYLSKADKSTILSPLRALADFSANYHYDPSDLGDWPGRIMIIESTNDPGSSEECRARLKLLYTRAEVVTLRNAGHTPGYNLPVEFSVWVSSFLQKT